MDDWHGRIERMRPFDERRHCGPLRARPLGNHGSGHLITIIAGISAADQAFLVKQNL